MTDIIEPCLFQSHASVIGRLFEGICLEILRGQGWKLAGSERLPDLGLDVDQVAFTKNGTKVFFEFKGSFIGKDPGLMRSTSVKVAIANALLLSLNDNVLYIVMTSHKPRCGSYGDMMLTQTTGLIVSEVISIHEPDEVKKLGLMCKNL